MIGSLLGILLIVGGVFGYHVHQKRRHNEEPAKADTKEVTETNNKPEADKPQPLGGVNDNSLGTTNEDVSSETTGTKSGGTAQSKKRVVETVKTVHKPDGTKRITTTKTTFTPSNDLSEA